MHKESRYTNFTRTKLERELNPINKILFLFLLASILLGIIIAVVYFLINDKKIVAKSREYNFSSKLISKKDRVLPVTNLDNLPSSYLEVEKIDRYRPKSKIIKEIPAQAREEINSLRKKEIELERKLSFFMDKMDQNRRDSELEEQKARESNLLFNSANEKSNNFFYDKSGERSGGLIEKDHSLKEIEEGRTNKIRSPYVVQAGSIIPAILMTGIDSSLPGNIVAQVKSDIYDSLTGKFLLIPKGAKLLGAYKADIAYGKERLLVAFTRLIRSDGVSISLSKYDGIDLQGRVGIEGKVNNHWAKIVAASSLSTLFSLGDRLLGSKNIYEEIYDSSLKKKIIVTTLSNVSQASKQNLPHYLNISPTLTINPGLVFNIIVHKDLYLTPYKHKPFIDYGDRK